MAGRAVKRSSDDGVFAESKKKKVLKDSVEYKEKTSSIVSNEDLRQKKAFFAYFGKKFAEGTNGKDVDNTKNICEKNDAPNQNTDDIDNDVQVLLVKRKEHIEKKQIILGRISSNSVKLNTNLPYVSRFVEDLGCFPKITHANRLAPLNLPDLNLNLKKELLYHESFKYSMLVCQTTNPISKKLVLEPYQVEINLPYMVSSFRKSTPTFPVVDFQKQIIKKKTASKKSATDIECLWIDKYKPMCTKDVLGNDGVVKGLKNWLVPNKKNLKISKKGQRYDDDDDFIFDSDSDSSQKAQHNLAILLGPSGCGKTSAVYAVANEINANVIELNASCNRNGKRIITDLMEATQSHAVKKNSVLNMFKGKINKPKNAKKKVELNEKMTIILIEDADIFFDNYDDGFLSAISTLATESKRPLVLTANDPFSNNLLKFYLSNEIIFNFIHPPKKHLICYLQLLALNEGAIMSENEIETFVHPFKPDIRQSILQLQFILNTGKLNEKSQNIYKRSMNSIWWNWPQVIGCNSTNIKNRKHANVHMANISQSLDSMLTFNLIHSKTQSYDFLDPQPFWNHIAKRDSASLTETYHWSDNSIQLFTDITEWIQEQINIKTNTETLLYPSSKELNDRERMWNTSKIILEQIGLDYCNRKNETCFDYMAAIRSLDCNQYQSNLRHSKMFSYLRRINIDVDCKDMKYFGNSFRLKCSSNS